MAIGSGLELDTPEVNQHWLMADIIQYWLMAGAVPLGLRGN
jgi:hypothetical protein